MKGNRKSARRGAAAVVGLLLLCGGTFVAWFVVPPFPPAPAQEAELPLFSAPSHVPSGEHWVLLGSTGADIPADSTVTPLSASVAVLEVRQLSSRALGVRITVSATAVGKLLRVDSVSAAASSEPELRLGQAVPSLSYDANIAAGDFIDGTIYSGEHLMYGYLDGTEVPLAALRIHNRETGRWHTHELALRRAREAQQAEITGPLDPAFVEVDPLETLPDTDGDGIPDFDEEPEVREPEPEFLGVSLAAGLNVLDLVAVDEAGNVSWRVLDVYSTASGGGGF